MPWWRRSPDRQSGRGAALAFGHQCGHREAFHATTQLFRSAVAEVAHLDQGLSRLGFALGPTAQGGPGGLDGVEGIGLAAAPAFLAVRPVDFEDLDSTPTRRR